MSVLFFSRALHLDPKLVRGESEWSPGSNWLGISPPPPVTVKPA